MLNPKIIDAIESQFSHERFVFWYDVDQEYLDCVEGVAISNVKFLMVDELPALGIKLEIAQADLQQKFLFYSVKEQPEPKHDWLLSYRLKGKTFSADQTQILMDELGLATHTLRPHLKQRSKFLAAKDRVERLKRWTNANVTTADDVDLNILTVISRSEQAEAFSIFNRVLSDLVQDDSVVPESSSRIWSEIKQYQLEAFFWDLAKTTFGYTSENRSLKHLMMSLLVSDMAASLNSASVLPKELSHFVMLNGAAQANAKVFISRWRSDVTLMSAYVQLTEQLADEMHINQALTALSVEDLMPIHTFGVVEKVILTILKNGILNGDVHSQIPVILQARRDGFWANLKVAKDFELTQAYSSCYDAIEAANTFFILKNEFSAGFSFASAKDGLDAYRAKIYLFDQTYRQFHYAAGLVEHLGWKLLQDLVEHVEGSYSGWFIPQFSSAWDKLVEGEQGLLSHWRVDGWTNQFNFYREYVQPLLNQNVKRVFVLISDAFRFEAAEELVKQLTAKNKFQASTDGMLGVLPSYTSLGMAALLPHQTLKYKRGQNLSVLADDLSTSGLEQRALVLEKYQGTAVKHEDLLALGKEKGREFIKPYQVVYIFHDHIDATGDKQATETKTFEAVKQTLDELAKIVGFVFNNLGASNLLVTADHGFMYQESALEGADKSNLLDKPSGALLTKKRYLIGDKLGNTTQAWFGNTQTTANTEPGEGSVDFWVPKGANRFHFVGGARFVHGSAMPQEIVVPVITVKQLESEKSKTKFVDVAVLGMVNKIVTNMQRFDLIQTESVSDYVLARTVKIGLFDGSAAISDTHTMTFDKAGQLMDDRKVSVMITLKSGDYDRFKDYDFIIKDVDSGVELVRQPMKVDLSFTNDF